MMPPLDDVTSCKTALSRSSNSPRYFAPAIERAHVEGEQFLVLEAVRHVAVDDAQRQALDDGGLADAGLADQHRIVLGAAGKYLDGAADFLVTADHRVELAVAGGLGQIAGIFLQRVIGVLGRLRVGGAALAQLLDDGIEVLRGDPRLSENFSGVAVLLKRNSEQEPLDRDEAVAGLVRDLLGVVEQPRGRGCEIDLAGARPRHLWHLAQRLFERRPAPAANCRRSGRSGPRPDLPDRRAGP